VNELYAAAGRNALYAKQGRASANDFAAETRALFDRDTNLMDHFNTVFQGGKWNHFMDQPHLGYTTWRDPPRNSLAAIPLREINVPEAAAMGIAVEGSESAWPGATNPLVLPRSDALTRQSNYFEVFNRGQTPFDATISAAAPWIRLSTKDSIVRKDLRVWVDVNWSNAAAGLSRGTIKVTGANSETTIAVEAFKPAEVTRENLNGFVESGGVVSIEPEHFTKNDPAAGCEWVKLPDYGRTLSGMRATGPVDAPAFAPPGDSPCLEYRMYLFSTGEVEVRAILSPALNFMPGRAMRLAVSFDDEAPKVVTIVPADYKAQNGNRDWENSVLDNARTVKSTHTIAVPGYHTLKVWMVDPGVVLQKLIVNAGGLKPSYLGPPESYHANR
jgi:hypothetical protein